MDPATPENPSRGAAEHVRTLAQKLREDGRERIDATRRTAAEQVEGLADAIDAARVRLDETQPTLARYTANLANGVERVATRLRDRTVEDLARDARSFASKNPGLFVLGSAAAGLLLARFLKVSTPVESDPEFTDQTRGEREPSPASSDLESQTSSSARYVSPEEGEPAVGGSYTPSTPPTH
jgi:hypothetical protein